MISVVHYHPDDFFCGFGLLESGSPSGASSIGDDEQEASGRGRRDEEESLPDPYDPDYESAPGCLREDTDDLISLTFRSIKAIREVSPSKVNMSEYVEYEDDCRRRDRSWLGGTIEEVDRWMVDGWPEGLQKLIELSQRIKHAMKPIRTPHRKRARDKMGDEIDIHAVNSGQLERAWHRVEKQPKERAKIILTFNVGGSRSKLADTFFWSAAAGLVIADRLGRRGDSVRIYAYSHAKGTYKNDDRPILVQTMVKDYSQVLSFDSLALTCCAGFLRRYVLTARWSLPMATNDGMGITQHKYPSSRIESLGKGVKFIDVPESINNEYDAVEFINKYTKEV